MAEYTVQDTTTGREITFEWTGSDPPTYTDMEQVFASAKDFKPPKPTIQRPQQPQETQTSSDIIGLMHGGGDITEGPNLNQQAMQGMNNAYTTAQNIGQVVPFGEIAANLITGFPGNIIAGLHGLRYLVDPFAGGLDVAAQKVKEAQDLLIYKPQTPGGQQLTQAAGAPLAPFEEAGGYWGGKLEESGYPMAGAAVHSALEASPLMLLRKGKIAKQEIAKLDAEISDVVRKGVNKSIRPSIVGKSDFKQMEKQYKNYETAIQDIIETNPEKIPQTVMETSKANLDTKVKLWNEATTMSGMAGEAGAIIDLQPVINEMRSIATHPNMIRLNKAGSNKLLEMAEAWESVPTRISPMEAEGTMANLNTLSKGFWKDPDPNSLGMGANMERLSHILRKELTGTVEKFSGPGYADFRKRYGSQAAIEKELANRALQDARKSPSGYFDILNAASAADFVHGLMRLDPAGLAGSVAIHWTKKVLQARADPNRIIAEMFNKTKDLMDRKRLMNGGQITVPTMNQGWEPNTWDSSFMKPALESLENANMPMRGAMANLNPMQGQIADMWKGVPRPPKPRATLVPKPLKAHMPKPLPSVETPVNMLEGIPFTPEQLAIMGKRFGPTAREMGMADIIATKTPEPLKAPNPDLIRKALENMRKGR